MDEPAPGISPNPIVVLAETEIQTKPKINNSQPHTAQEEDANFMLELELEWQWRDSQRQPNDRELLETFPEAKSIIPEKLKEWQETRLPVVAKIKHKLKTIRKKVPENEQWFARSLVKHLDFPELMAIDKHIARLKRLRMLTENKPVKAGWITPEHIAQARAVSVVDFMSQTTKLRKRGSKFVALCPLHHERTPSFTIYPDNHWHCFGCSESGDIIKLIQKLQGLPFLEVVRNLTNER